MALQLRKPTIDEWKVCVRLIYISGPDLYTYIFIAREPEIYEFLHLLYKKPGLYSKDNIIIEEENGKIRGLILAYPARDLKQLGKMMLGYLIDILKQSGIINFVKLLSRLKFNSYFPKTGDDELFISNIAVFKEYRGKGISKKLLLNAEEIALEKGLTKLSLFVETDNTHAKAVYDKFGFQEEKKVILPKKYNKHHLYGFYKMTKYIGKK